MRRDVGLEAPTDALRLRFVIPGALAHLLVEPGVLDGHRHLAGQDRHEIRVLAAEVAGVDALQRQHAQDPILDDERNHQLRARNPPIHCPGGNVIRILLAILHQDDLTALHRAAYHPLAHADLRVVHELGVVTDGGAPREAVALLVQEQHAEQLVIDDLARQLTHAVEEKVEIQDGGDLTPDLVQHLHGQSVPAALLEQPGVLDGHGDGAGQRGHDGQMLVGEEEAPAALHVHHAHHLVLVEQRHHEVGGVLLAVGGVVVAVLAHVSHQHRLAPLNGAPA